jgi:hypothetical protein
VPAGKDDVWRERNQFRRIFAFKIDPVLAPADIDPQVAILGPAQLL